jgi:hypothetical protein
LLSTGDRDMVGPYETRRVWAVAPVNNESGTRWADGVVMADHLAQQFEQAPNIDVLPVNRVLAAMAALEISAVTSPAEARGLMQVLNVDSLVIGTLTAYDPYDPPTIGLILELLTSERARAAEAVQIRRMSRAATSDELPTAQVNQQPQVIVSAVLDAADPDVRRMIKRYADRRGPVDRRDDQWHRYRISSDLYSEFVSYVMAWRLLDAERARLAQLTAEPVRP